MTEFTTTFEVTATPTEAWKALEQLRDENLADSAAIGQWWLPAYDCSGTEVEADPGRSLTVRKDTMPCAETLISITFEHIESGARVTVVQSGFDEKFVEGTGAGFWIVCEQLGVDLHLFFATGLRGGRPARPWTMIGCGVVATALGLEVTDVYDGMWASRAGLRAGDLLLTVAGAPLTIERDLITVQRIISPGQDLTATWVRDRELIEATQVL
jgi:hypothetical protein